MDTLHISRKDLRVLKFWSLFIIRLHTNNLSITRSILPIMCCMPYESSMSKDLVPKILRRTISLSLISKYNKSIIRSIFVLKLSKIHFIGKFAFMMSRVTIYNISAVFSDLVLQLCRVLKIISGFYAYSKLSP